MGQQGPSIEDLIRAEADRVGVPVPFALAVAEQESSFNPYVLGPKLPSGEQAVGTFQLLPSTAKTLGIDPTDPVQNIHGGVQYLRQLLDKHQGDSEQVLREYGGVVRDQTYVPSVLARLQKFSQATAAPAPGARPGDIVVPSAADVAARTQSRTGPTASEPPPPPSWLGQAWDAAKTVGTEATESLRAAPAAINAVVQQGFWHPWESAKAVHRGVNQAFWHPIDTANAVFGEQVQKFREAYEQGDYARAALEAKNIPLDLVGAGSRLSEAEEHMRRGEYAKGLGATIDVAGGLVGPEALRAAGGALQVTPRLIRSKLNAVKQAAVDFGMREGIPIDVGTATGNVAAKNILATAESTLPGAMVAQGVQLKRGQRLAAVSDTLAERVHPLPVSPEAAGVGVTGALESRIAQEHAAANQHYTKLRAIAAQPGNTRQVPVRYTNDWTPQGTLQQVPVMGPMQLPANVRAAKAQLRPLRDELMRRMPVTRQEMSEGLTVLNNIVDGPDYVPALDLDRDLSAIKKLTREVDLPELRDVSQGLSTKAQGLLQNSVDRAVRQAGPDATRAYEQGRLATVRKYAIDELRDVLHPKEITTAATRGLPGAGTPPPRLIEGAPVFKTLTQAGDVHTAYLSELAKIAPQEMPKLGRAVLDQLIEKATAEGGFGRGAGVWADWQKLGPDTKALLFSPQHVKDLDEFFLLSKMLGEHPNPSRSYTALATFFSGMSFAGGVAPGLGVNAAAGGVASLLNSRRGVRLLTEGAHIHKGTTAAAIWLAEVTGLMANKERYQRPADQRPAPRVGTPPPAPPR